MTVRLEPPSNISGWELQNFENVYLIFKQLKRQGKSGQHRIFKSFHLKAEHCLNKGVLPSEEDSSVFKLYSLGTNSSYPHTQIIETNYIKVTSKSRSIWHCQYVSSWKWNPLQPKASPDSRLGVKQQLSIYLSWLTAALGPTSLFWRSSAADCCPVWKRLTRQHSSSPRMLASPHTPPTQPVKRNIYILIILLCPSWRSLLSGENLNKEKRKKRVMTCDFVSFYYSLYIYINYVRHAQPQWDSHNVLLLTEVWNILYHFHVNKKDHIINNWIIYINF